VLAGDLGQGLLGLVQFGGDQFAGAIDAVALDGQVDVLAGLAQRFDVPGAGAEAALDAGAAPRLWMRAPRISARCQRV
jgi:hypothetical protein